MMSVNVFMRLGIKSITMDDLSRELGMSKKTLYLYVKDKSDLILKCIDWLVTHDQMTCTTIKTKKLNAIQEMYEIYKTGTERIKNFHPSVVFDLQKYYPEAWARLESHRVNFIKMEIFDNIEKGKSEGVYRKEVDSRLASMFYSLFIHVLIEPTLKYSEGAYTVQSVILEHVLYHLHAITTEKGKKLINQIFSI